MILALSFTFLFAWIVAFFVLHVSAVAIHVLLASAVVAALVHTIRRRRYRGDPHDLPADAIK
jgi:hypothetical protein